MPRADGRDCTYPNPERGVTAKRCMVPGEAGAVRFRRLRLDSLRTPTAPRPMRRADLCMRSRLMRPCRELNHDACTLVGAFDQVPRASGKLSMTDRAGRERPKVLSGHLP